MRRRAKRRAGAVSADPEEEWEVERVIGKRAKVHSNTKQQSVRP